MYNSSSNNPGWRLVHNNKEVITFAYFANGVTSSIHTIFEAATKEECLAEIARLSLEYTEEAAEDE